MRAITVIPESRRVALGQLEEPSLVRSTDVKLRILDVGICGTDREICRFDYGTPPRGQDALVIGHEALGEVIDVGADVTRVAIGDLVVPMVRRPCAHATCLPCRSGRQDFCATGDFHERGIKDAHGFMTEFIVDDEQYMNRVPRELRDWAVLVEPLTIAEKALQQLWQVQSRLPWVCPTHKDRPEGCGRAVVLGAGPVGLLGAMALRNAGFKVTVYSRGAAPNDKAEIAALIGADYVSSAEVTPTALAERLGNIDLIYEAVGASRTSFELMQVLGVNGVFIFTGVPGRKAPVEVDTDALMRNLVLKNQVVFGTVNAGRAAFERAIEDLEAFRSRWPAAVDALISGRHDVDAHDELLLGRSNGIKHVLRFAR